MFDFVTGTYHLLLVFMIFYSTCFHYAAQAGVSFRLVGKKQNGVFVIAVGRIIYGFSFRNVFGTERRFV